MRDGITNTVALATFIAKDGRSLRKLAVELDVSPSYLAKIVRGEKEPSLGLALRIATHLKVPLAAFYTVDPSLSAQVDVLESGVVGAG